MLNLGLGLMARIAIGLIFFVLVACAGPAPIEDYSIARTALDAARAAEAPKYAPGFYNQAEELYHQGRFNFDDREYEKAKKLFKESKESAEKAENYTVLKKAETGGGL